MRRTDFIECLAVAIFAACLWIAVIKLLMRHP